MSLFIASLAFGDGVDGSAGQARADRLAILLGSTFSAVMGYLILYSGGNKPNQESPKN